ncbi:MAG: hypothetical protein DMD36_09955 [Gemmatimonadetes bacterium]|nr:MAG: hypothetical protein DMD36_09955 [Gemmatimonadota bacterium]
MQATAEETMTEVEDTEAKIVAALETVFAADGEQWLSRPFFTGRVKEVLGALGHELGFEVACHKSDYPRGGREWLYDMTWYVLDKTKGGMLMRQPMVLESEWEIKNRDDDFQKLVQARADVRVWLFTAANAQEIDNYIARCRDQAQSFAGRQPGDRYVFTGFDFQKKVFAPVQTFRV